MSAATHNGNGNGSGNGNQGASKVPHDIDVERQVLGSMLLDYACIPELMTILRTGDFYVPAHQLIYEALTAIYTENGLVDLSLLAAHLKTRDQLDSVGGHVALANLEQGVYYTGSSPEMAHIVASKSRARRLIEVCRDTAITAMADATPVDDQIEKAHQRLFTLMADSRSESIEALGDLWSPTIDNIEARKNGERFGATMGYSDIDNRFRMDPTSLTIVAARPSIGKTALGVNISYNVAQGGQGRCLLFSLEMARQQVTERFICRHAALDSDKLQGDCKYLSNYEIQKLRAAEKHVRECLPVDIDDTAGLSLVEITSKARRHAIKNPDLSMIMIDYLGLMELSHSRGSSRNEDLGEVSRGLKRLAMELRIPVVALQQLNRNIEHRGGKDKNARPRLSDLRESGHLEEDADNVVFLHRERVQDEAKREQSPSGYRPALLVETEVIVAKQRQGPIFTAKLQLDLRTGTFRNTA